jgi:hypothetical protein
LDLTGRWWNENISYSTYIGTVVPPKTNDKSHNSSTYHKKDGTPVRAILKREAAKEIVKQLKK